jgi:hypothetical protein
MREKFFKKYLTPIYQFLFILSVLIGFITFAIGYTETHVSSFLSMIVGYIPESFYHSLYNYRYLIVSLCFLLIILYLLHIIHLKKDRFKKTSQAIDYFQRELGGEIADILLSYGNICGDSVDKEKFDEISLELDDFLCKFATHICKVFNHYTGNVCHVAIKTLNNGNVTTWIREKSVSESSRSSIDEALNIFPYEKNTAFKEIIDNENKYFYMNNWLSMSKFLRRYKNLNPQWKKYYRATLVVPITKYTHPQMINSDNVWGFICVDNKKGGFDSGAAPYILSSFAQICLNIFDRVPNFNQPETYND